jgi:predicted 2-oxoglutarate/Fe(II)-dependent dioxygenase YbiX
VKAEQPQTHVVIDGFLDEATCQSLRTRMSEGATEDAQILDASIRLDQMVRRAAYLEVDEATQDAVDQYLESSRAYIEARFGRLGSREGASLLRYQPGDFYLPHRDRGDLPSWPAAALRAIAVVIFLNSAREAAADGTFRGGTLRLFVDERDSRFVDVYPRAGTLIAFPATTRHEVTVVRNGVRDVVVDWYQQLS